MRYKVNLMRRYPLLHMDRQVWLQPMAVAIVICGSVALSVADAGDAPAAPSSTSTSSSLAHTLIHLYDTVSGYSDAEAAVPGAATLCSAPGTQLKVGDDDGT